MKKLPLIVFFSYCCLIAWTQEGQFSFLHAQQQKAGKKSVAEYKKKTAESVFKALVAGQGDFRRPPPHFVMNNSRSTAAWARPGKAEIGLEEQAYDICASFGADSLNALAALLSHELVHYYEEHDWSQHFVREHEDLSTAQRLKKIEERLKLEAQADYLGGFLAYSVGFDVHGIMPDLLRKIYSEDGYDLPEEDERYPSLQDRIAMSGQAMDRLWELQLVFEMGTYLNLLEYHEDADQYYQYILRDFQSRDIYNNAGATALLHALGYFSKKEVPYGLPIELDPNSRLKRRTTRTNPNEVEERKKQIGKALEYFDRALLLDEQYAPAFLNKAAAFILLEDWEEAKYWLRKAGKEDLNDKMSNDVLVLRGIIAARQDDAEVAKETWGKAAATGSTLAGINLRILTDGSLEDKVADDIMGFAAKKERIDAMELENFIVNNAFDRSIDIDEDKILGFHQRPNFVVYTQLSGSGSSYISIQIVDENFTGKSMEGIAIGDQQEQLTENYGAPESMIQTPDGAYWVYPNRNMFFQLTDKRGVSGWGIFRIRTND